MNVPFVDLKSQYKSISGEIKEQIDEVLENTAFILGDKVSQFEIGFAKYCESKHAVGVNSGTAALHLALVAHGIGPGDEVITVPNTFIATAEAISHAGAVPVLVDIDAKSYNIDVTKIAQAITPKTKAIIPVHLFGQSADMDPVSEIAKKHGLVIIEDCCQAHGSQYKGKKVPVTTTGCFSFYPGKNLGAYGEAGAVVTDDDEVAAKVKMLRDHGQEKKYFHKYIGYNCRMAGFQGAVLNIKLKYLDQWIAARQNAARLYDQLLDGVVDTPCRSELASHVYHLYVIRTPQRDAMIEYLGQANISTGIHYPIPIHLQAAYASLGKGEGSYPVSEQAAKEILSLPIYPEITEEQIEYVCEKIKSFQAK
ncbi:MAG: DegT/DnrJ/EryC1/StrS family aminotransferase [Phycisphaerae bacterium]|nr:DegT/DnrJ/EryC1/StrS family aminotransferase [Phycisphaerae bacterium]